MSHDTPTLSCKPPVVTNMRCSLLVVGPLGYLLADNPNRPDLTGGEAGGGQVSKPSKLAIDITDHLLYMLPALTVIMSVSLGFASA